MELVVIQKEILFYGKKEIHNILALKVINLDGSSFVKPLMYSSKGKDDNYYYNYVVLDYFTNNETLLKL